MVAISRRALPLSSLQLHLHTKPTLHESSVDANKDTTEGHRTYVHYSLGVATSLDHVL